MRIGIVTDTYTPQVNGVTTVVRRIVTLLAAQGHTAAVVAPQYPDFLDSTADYFHATGGAELCQRLQVQVVCVPRVRVDRSLE